MWRFRYEEFESFDMYCIDAAGDHVDIDRKRDFEGLTAPYWARLNQMKETQRNLSEEISHTSGLTNPLDSTVSFYQQKKLLSEEEVTDDGRSTETVIRLFVRDSCNHRWAYSHLQDKSTGRTSLSSLFHIGTDGGNPMLDSTISSGGGRLTYSEEMLKMVAPKRRSISGSSAPNMCDPCTNRGHDEFCNLNQLSNTTRNDAYSGSATLSGPSFFSPKHHSFLESLRVANALPVADTFRVCVANQLQWTRMAVLGKGSFGTVYEGITTDGKIMAVKVQELPINDNADEIHAVRTEMNLLCSMAHRNIVTYYGCQVIEHEGGSRQMEIFLELCHGGTLTQLRRRFERAKKPFSISLVRAYTRQILEGLAYLHSCNVMHRDIKCDNVLISATGEAKLSDFGCSKCIGTATLGREFARGGGKGEREGGDTTTSSTAAHNSIVGSPLFMAPEVLQANGADGGGVGNGGGYSMAADIWSVGCVVLELLGRDPWNVSGRNVFQLMFHIAQAKGLPNGVPGCCPAVLLDFFHKCFERDPARRWTAVQLLKHPWMVCPESELEEVLSDDAREGLKNKNNKQQLEQGLTPS
ncbi:unnamed protein product [Phytomonas sp. Hart1]|nr:unnamed protein product [Phytomonas sp. Hart1]|eukprot:CCW69713.1 unnamed protein product [Phytomonas sp. isolate Hart1]